MARDIGEWLKGLGLGRYAEAFADNEIDLRALPHITEEDLKEIGVALGGRRKMLAAIAKLGNSDEPSTADERPDERPANAGAERRHLTVMFCDLVGSTALSERLDPEDLREVIRSFQSACAGAIGRFEGYIARYMGDGMLVYFGYPQAHEDDAERAVRAGLGIVEAVGGLDKAEGETLRVRIGIATGDVVVGDIIGEGASEERAVLGDTPNLAARLQGLAKPGTVVIAEATMGLIGALFDSEDLGARRLKGLAEPVHAYRVGQETPAPSRFEAAAERGLTPLVGREVEIGLLAQRWGQAKDGEAQVVMLSGEAGVGKSRILRAFRGRYEGELENSLLYYGSPHHRNSALYPVINQMARALGFKKGDGPDARLDKLEAGLGALGLDIAEHAPVLAHLHSLSGEGRYGALDADAAELRRRTFASLLAIISSTADLGPVLVAVEDLHWIDPTTLEFVGMAIEGLNRGTVLMVLTFRPEFVPPWSGYAHLTSLALNRLSGRESRALIANVAGGKSLPDEVAEVIVERADGVSLYIEEITKSVLEADLLEEGDDAYRLTGPLSPLAIPESLHDSMMARLDRLASVKQVAQMAAVLGRAFDHELLAAVASPDEPDLNDALDRLVNAELIFRRGVPPNVRYKFKHALVQDAAYGSLLRSQRQGYHRRIASVLEEKFEHVAESEPELLAHHSLQGEVWDKAVLYFHRAGTKAATRSSYPEAVTCFEQALGALTHLPESRKTLEQGIDIRLALRNSLHPLGEHQRLFEHISAAETLAERIDDQRRLGWISAYMATYFAMSGDPDHAVQSGQRALTIAKDLGEFPLQIAANFRLGLAHLTSDYHRATEFFSSNVESLKGELIRERFGEAGPASVLSRIWLVVVLAERGKFVEGIARGEEAVEIAEMLEQPWSRIGSYYSVGALYLRKGDLTKAISLFEQALELSRAYPFFWLPWISSSLGYAYALSGNPADALPLLEKGLEQSASKSLWRFYALQAAYLSEGYRLANQPEDANRLASQALNSSRQYHARGHEAWALWNFGELGLRGDPPDLDKTEVFYRQALALAEELGMRPLIAHCHHGLGTLYRLTGPPGQPEEHLDSATALYRKFEMRHWLEQADRATD